MFAFIQNLRRAVSLPILLLPALLLPVAASAVTGVADEIITTLYTDLSLAAPTTTLHAACQGFDCEYHTGVALTDAGRVKVAELVASGRGSPSLFSPR
jgi:hypothetical protein